MFNDNASVTLRVRPSGPSARSVDEAVADAVNALIGLQNPDGHWVFELEADATIPAEYLLLMHILDEIDPVLEAEIAAFLRAGQGRDGGWPLFHGGAMDISCTVKAYFALKAAGDSLDAPHMVRARDAILARGGAARVNVFTRILLAQFGEVPWRAVPAMPVEIMNLPDWSPFHIGRISYWSRTVVVPLLVVMAHRLRAKNPRNVTIRELFLVPPERVRDWNSNLSRSAWGTFFRAMDTALHAVQSRFPAKARQQAIERAVAFVTERLNGEDGLGAIFPAMVNATLMYHCLGYAPDHPAAVTARESLKKLLVRKPGRTYAQPCLSPVWDTAIICNALLEAGGPAAIDAARRGADWLVDRQILDVEGDWIWKRPGLAPGGWAFQYNNAHYPDTDDTAMVVIAMQRLDPISYAEPIRRARNWIVGMQSRNGGWGAFDVDNQHEFLNHIPFADHGALLDPPTSDVTARCVWMLTRLGEGRDTVPTRRGFDFLEREQEKDGSWFGRWGTNYIYGTWSVLEALGAAGYARSAPEVARAANWLLAHQRADGGWGEDGASYWPGQPHGEGPVSTASQTAWALLGLMAAGRVDDPAVERGIEFLIGNRNADGLWTEEPFTAVGFPRVFYLKYHGYAASFPLWALARYRSLKG